MLNPPSELAPHHEIFGKEISKLQELILQQEHAYEAEYLTLADKLKCIEEETKVANKRIIELESKESDQSEKSLERLEAENTAINEENENLTVKNKEIMMVIDEYQRSISNFKSQYDTEEQQLAEQKKVLAQERDISLQHVDSMEAEFNSIHQKYEKCKSLIEQFKINDKRLVELSHDSSERLRLFNLCYQNLKDRATEKLELCHTEHSAITKNNKTEQAKLQAILQTTDLKCESQEERILQNSNELQETMKLCDELIGKFRH